MRPGVAVVGIIALGLLSRALPLGWVLWDKYLGDALYAAMVYLIGKWIWDLPPHKLAIASIVVMTAIEAFQLTGIPLNCALSPSLPLRILGRLLGTGFSWFDLAAYAVGIAVIWILDSRARMTA